MSFATLEVMGRRNASWILASVFFLSVAALAETSVTGPCPPESAAPRVDPELVPALPCNPALFEGSETQLLGSTIDGEGMKWLRSIQETVKKVRVGVAILGIAGPAESHQENRSKKNAFDLSLSLHKRLACCDGKITEKLGGRLRVSLYATAEQRFFYGVPYIGELGVRARERIGLDNTHLIGLECAAVCSDHSAGLSVSGELYFNLIAGLSDVSGGVKGSASIGFKTCSQEPYFSTRIELAKLVVFAQASAAWGLFSKTWEGPIFPERFPMYLYQYPDLVPVR